MTFKTPENRGNQQFISVDICSEVKVLQYDAPYRGHPTNFFFTS